MRNDREQNRNSARRAVPRPAPAQQAGGRRMAYDYAQEDDYDDDDEEEYDNHRPLWHWILGILIVLGFAAAIAYGLQQGLKLYAEVDGANTLGDPVEIDIAYGTETPDIAKALMDAGVIDHDWLFNYYARYSGKGASLQYGKFTLQRGMSYNDMLAALSVQQVHRETITLTFPEGTTAVGIAQILAENDLCGVEEFLACANGEDGSTWSEYSFWDKIPDTPGRLMKCEGYLFPDTYEFYVGESVNYYVDVFYKQFEKQSQWLLDDIEAKGTTLNDVVILASFIQEEGGVEEEDAKISACFHNRLEIENPELRPYCLQSNTCCGIMQDVENNYLWNSPTAYYYGWPQQGYIPQDVLDAYDTYNNAGLPAGPISCPGYDALEAALNPDESFMQPGQEYFFFVTGHPDSDVAGQYFYARTYAEHLANTERCGWAVE